MELTTQEGFVEYRPGGFDKQCQTYYKIVSPVEPSRSQSTGRPLLIISGGPGMGHNYCLSLQSLMLLPEATISQMIFYDAVGCGKSTTLKEKANDPLVWTLDLYVNETTNLVSKLGLADNERGFDVLAHSFGSMIGAPYAAQQPKGLKHLILSNGLSDVTEFHEAHYEHLKHFPDDLQETVKTYESHVVSQLKESPVVTEDCAITRDQYLQAVGQFQARHFCRLSEPTEYLKQSLANVYGDYTSWFSVMGPMLLTFTGTAVAFGAQIQPLLHKIMVPTLVINGKHDQCTDKMQQNFLTKIPHVKWEKLDEDGDSHMPWMEQNEDGKFWGCVGKFLAT